MWVANLEKYCASFTILQRFSLQGDKVLMFNLLLWRNFSSACGIFYLINSMICSGIDVFAK